MGNSSLPVWQQLVFLALASLPGFLLFAGITYGVNNEKWSAQIRFNERLERKVDDMAESMRQTQNEVFVLKKSNERNR